ncbi:hypothetical protein [Alteribacillus iranensis]|uniref:Replication initiation and membrane attachment n=1 Tax=Alteribacillus iranensis TaxID=930128 RepID=A0A1I2BWX0_9BACI|nr:hypothetical protein [Alteribacillus iranensis]SFE60629.1 hypothetical protein SAMN05192532_102556 [Alteribacillus iranensis]
MKSEKPRNWEETVCYFERTKPEEYLLSLSDGTPPLPSKELLAIERARKEYRLPDSVITVLLDFLLKTNDFHFNTHLFYEVALLWSRKNIDNVRSAMSEARDEFKARRQWDFGEKKRHYSQLEEEIQDFKTYLCFKENASRDEKQEFEQFKKYMRSSVNEKLDYRRQDL